MWINGVSFSHADAAVFGWYAFSRVNPDAKEVWEGSGLERVGEWLKQFFDDGFVKEEDLP